MLKYPALQQVVVVSSYWDKASQQKFRCLVASSLESEKQEHMLYNAV